MYVLPGGLFAGRDLPDEARERTDQALRKVSQMNVDELLGREVESLVDESVHEFATVTIHWDAVTMSEPEQIQLRDVQNAFGDRITRQAAQSVLKVPLDGEATLLTYRAHSGAPVMGVVEGSAANGSVSFIWQGELNANPTDSRVVQKAKGGRRKVSCLQQPRHRPTDQSMRDSCETRASAVANRS